MAGAQTGTGKTAAFSLPILHHLLEQAPQDKPQPQALILVPTRELAEQVHANIASYCVNTPIKTAMVYGGVSISAQVTRLKTGVDLIVATPGRLLDHLRHRVINLKHVQYLVFDEADRMLDMGFMDEIKAILKLLPKARQTLLFSATFNDTLFNLSKRLLNQPKLIEVDQRNTAAADIEQLFYAVDTNKKSALIAHLIKHKPIEQTLIFSRTKQGADEIAKQLQQAQINAKAFHSDYSQAVRASLLDEFKQGKIQALVATDVAARGIDIKALNYVINYELPFVCEDYIHRIGRTGRAGNKGTAITLFSNDDARLLESLEVLLDKRLPQQWYPGFEPDLSLFEETPRRNKKGAQKQRARQRALQASKRK